MKIVISVLLGLAAIPVVAFLVGLTLPTAHEATVSAEFDRSAERIWDTITDVQGYPAWRPDVTRVEVTFPSGADATVREGLAWTEWGSSGTTPFRVERVRAPRELVARIDTDELPYGGAWTYEVEPIGESRARLTITERGEVYNPIFRFVSRFIIGHTATMETYLDALAAAPSGA